MAPLARHPLLTPLPLLLLALAPAVNNSGCGDDRAALDGGPFGDAFGTRELGPPPSDQGGPSCQLGQVNSCASCNNVCPGYDNAASQRLCEGRSCTVRCKAEYYDCDGLLDNGCEAEDDLPLHDTVETAKDLGSIDDCDGSGTVARGRLPSDSRQHLDDPPQRSEGRPDFYKVAISDGYCSVSPYVKLDASNLSGVQLLLKVDYLCSDGETSVQDEAPVTGGSSGEIQLEVDCPGLDDGGTLTIEVRKVGASGHSGGEYTLLYNG